MWSTAFWKDTAERTIRTFAQALLALIGTNVVDITDLDWTQMLLAAATAAVITVLTCVVATGVGTKGDPSFTGEAKP
jgi:hypothetical protein